jgi:hypothetical protein
MIAFDSTGNFRTLCCASLLLTELIARTINNPLESFQKTHPNDLANVVSANFLLAPRWFWVFLIVLPTLKICGWVVLESFWFVEEAVFDDIFYFSLFLFGPHTIERTKILVRSPDELDLSRMNRIHQLPP